MSELKPCPFCGGEAKLLEGFYSQDGRGDIAWVVLCKSCDARKIQSPDWSNWNPYRKRYEECEAAMRNAVIEAWNTRYERTCQIVDKYEGYASSHLRLLGRCSICDEVIETTHEFCPNCGARVKEDA